MSEGTLLLSPHSDDISMSAFGIVTKKLLPGPLRLLTVFSRSNYMVLNRSTFGNLRTLVNLLPRPNELASSLGRNASHLGAHPDKILLSLLDLREAYKISRIRLMEDMSFSKRTGMKFSYLGLPCSKYRHARAIMDPNWSLANEQELQGKLFQAFKYVISKMKVQNIVSPWPYGRRQHIDHRLVNEAATRVAENTGARLLYLDDQPYSRRPLGTMVDSRGCTYAPIVAKLDPLEMRRKFGAMSLYRSQMRPEYFRFVSKPPPGSPDLPFSETLWQPT